MYWNRCFCFFSAIFLSSAMLLYYLQMDLPVSYSPPSTFISDGRLEFRSYSFIQAKKACPVDFEIQNYTIITSKCKGPNCPPDLCCPAFKEFACRYANDLNDLTNDCATTMFSYINLNGNYPPGLLASECREGKEGIACPVLAPPSASANESGSYINLAVLDNESGTHNVYSSPLLMLTAGSVLLLFKSL